MRLISYRPQFTPFPTFRRRNALSDLFDTAFDLAGTGLERKRAWSPALDIHEDTDKVTVKVEAAGLKKEDFEISLQDDRLTISGERKAETEKREGETLRTERYFGRFSRSVTLSGPVKTDEVGATYEDGVLTVTLPKSEEAKPRRIEVGVK